MRGKVSRIILQLAGWKISGQLPDSVRKCIVIMAPHTSNWDFLIGWLGYRSLGLHAKYLIKKEAFFFPIAGIVRWLGGIPVDRDNSLNVALQVSHLFKNTDEMILTITPEGTRKLNKHWKKGFYSIARHANVPVIMGFLDYKNKTGGFGPELSVTGNYQEDMQAAKAFYSNKTARYPEKFNYSPQYDLAPISQEP